MLTKKKDCAKIQNVSGKALWKNSLKRAPKAFQMANRKRKIGEVPKWSKGLPC